MRVANELNLAGYFWLPYKEDNKCPGYLKVSDGGKIDLELVGLFDNSIDGLRSHLNSSTNLERIVGEVEKYGFVSLENCTYLKRNFSFGVGNGIPKSLLSASYAILGAGSDEEILINEFKFSVDGLNEWIGLSGVNIDHDLSSKSGSIKYVPLEEFTLSLNSGFQLKITYEWSLPSVTERFEAKISHRSYLSLCSDEQRSVDDFARAAGKLQSLISFAVDKNVSITSVEVKSRSIVENYGDREYSPSCKLFYESRPYDAVPPKIDIYQRLFVFSQIKDCAELFINNWFSAYETMEPALNLYFSTRTGGYKFQDAKFLALAQALETYHRRTSVEKSMPEDSFNNMLESIMLSCPPEHREWLQGRTKHGNEISLSRRIKSIIEPFKDLIGSSKDRGKLIVNIVNTRNYLTHYDKELEDKSVKGIELYFLCWKMEAILQLHILQVLGFSIEEVRGVYRGSGSLNRKLSTGNA